MKARICLKCQVDIACQKIEGARHVFCPLQCHTRGGAVPSPEIDASAYLREKAFSLYTATKTKYRNQLKAKKDLILQVTSIAPQFEYFFNTKPQYARVNK